MAPPDLRLVPVRSDDEVAVWVDVHNRISPCWPEGPVSLAHEWSVAPRWLAVVAWKGDRPVGIAHVEVPHWAPTSRHAEGRLKVEKADRRRGIGTALWRHVSDWAAGEGLEGLDIWMVEGDPDGSVFWARRGFVEVERERRSRLDVAAALARIGDIDLPDGIRLTTVAERPDTEQGIYEVSVEAMPDVPGAEVYRAGDFAHWREGEFAVPGMLPECSVVALAGDRVVGYALITREEVRPDVANHSMTGVARDWRGRGIASAVKREVVRRVSAYGIAYLEAENEDRNAPMLAVNRRLGYEPLPDVVKLRGPLAPGV